MDVYNSLPDVFTYHSLKHSGYEYTWTTQQDHKGSKASAGTNKNKASCPGAKASKEPCPICQEKQRRPLSTYIRSKSRQDHKNDACIEEETDNPEQHSQKTGELNIQAQDQHKVK
ncbi:uncharacterized protein LOC126263649 [Schistocerca nitens]|uniref:uncharacterized protein LOC126263649 n=1 Tax=Schistocerca nitens TaxID=7011 RepID=UPI002118BF64|nr:uncharacterized protein LOC126263649 [Schistocerca nitens]